MEMILTISLDLLLSLASGPEVLPSGIAEELIYS